MCIGEMSMWPIRWVYGVRGVYRGEVRKWLIRWVYGVRGYVLGRDEGAVNQVGLFCKGCV